jgi:hypothetical protein
MVDAMGAFPSACSHPHSASTSSPHPFALLHPPLSLPAPLVIVSNECDVKSLLSLPARSGARSGAAAPCLLGLGWLPEKREGELLGGVMLL